MSASTVTAAPPSGAPLRGRRAEVLTLLRNRDRAMTAGEVAAATGLAVTTARFHLDALVADDLATRGAEQRTAPGRPRILYRAAGPSPGPRNFRALAEILVRIVASLPDADSLALGTGRAWGEHLVERAAPSEQVDSADAMARLERLLSAVGFQPQTRRDGDTFSVRMRHCPFRELADAHGEVVCAVHRGLMEGALAELGAPVKVEWLRRSVGRDLCQSRLRAGPSDDGTDQAAESSNR